MNTLRLTGLTLLLILGSGTLLADDNDDSAGIDYLFAWPFITTEGMSPRGGTTKAPIPDAVTTVSERWQALAEPGLDGLERDRRAILAMAGEYRVSFDFLETVGFEPDFKPARPYRSWATEFVEVIANEPEFISLQHVLVMFFEDDQGELIGPMVTKHWRQDWSYQDTEMREYLGNSVWQRRSLKPEQVEGAWTQAVFQVDDSPRYQNYGRWQHLPTHSVWTSNEARRPLPRREFSVRDDYNVIIGTNRQTILPSGWLHEQDNLKARIDESGVLDSTKPFVAREMGINRYQTIADYDFAAGKEYWQKTSAFWALVRAAWSDQFAEHDQVQMQGTVDGQSMMMTLFGMAGEIAEQEEFDRAESSTEIEALFDRHVQPATVN